MAPEVGAAPPALRVALSGGGSGGHVYPALAIGEALTKAYGNEVSVFYIGTQRGLEADLVPRAGVAFQPIHAGAWLNPGALAKLRGGWNAVYGTWEAWRILVRMRPDVVVATGGYVTGPVGLAAALLGIPLVVHEQNVWPGLTNRLLAKRSRMVLTTYADTARYLPEGVPIRVTGYPVRPSVVQADREAARRALGLDPSWVTVVATGGSQGAPAVNALMTALWHRAETEPNWAVIWATGPRRFDQVAAELGSPENSNRLRVAAYLYNLDVALAAADVVVGRAGAGTLAEAAARGLPMILIPSPHVSEHHQEKNAEAWAERGAAVVVAESQAAADGVAAVVRVMQDQDKRTAMADAARRLHHPDALDRIVQAVSAAALTAPRWQRRR